MPFFVVDKLRPRPCRLRRQTSLYPRPSSYNDSVTPEQLQQLLLLAEYLTEGKGKAAKERKCEGKAAVSDDLRKALRLGSKAAQRARNRFCPYHSHHLEKAEKKIFPRDVSDDKCETENNQTWTATVDCSAFKPTELKVRVDGGSVHVHAFHDEKSGGNRTTFEMNRTIQLPSDVSKRDIDCVFKLTSGQLVFTAPRRNNVQPSVEPLDNPPSSKDTHESAAEKKDSVPAKESASEAPAAMESVPETETDKNDFDAPAVMEGVPETKTDKNDSEAPARETTPSETDPTRPTFKKSSDKSAEPRSDDPVDDKNDVSSGTSIDVTRPQANETSDVMAVDDATGGDCVSEKILSDVSKCPSTSEENFSLTFHMEKFRPEDIEVTVEGNVMTLKGEREVKELGFSGEERMERKISLPENVDPDRLKCVFMKDGRLILSEV